MHDAHPAPSETLRRAAALMRERAERCPAAVDTDNWSDEAAEHIASWHPAVALAVADWLDFIAAKQEAAERVASRLPVVNLDDALTVARAYLGGDA